MSAVEALKAARAAGIQLGIDGDDLVLEAPAPPPPAVIDLLSRHKAEVVSMPARAKAHRTARSGAPIGSGSASAAIPERPRLSRLSRRACGIAPTNDCVSGRLTPRYAPIKPSRSELPVSWRGSTTGKARGVFGHERERVDRGGDIWD